MLEADIPIIAAITPNGADNTDDLVSSIANSLMNQGWRVRGLTQEKFRKDGYCQYAFVDLETGLARSISQNLGTQSESCTLNLQSMAEASQVLQRIADEGADIAVVNRFGKQEANGRGFAAEMLDIMSRGIPLVTIVQDEYLPAWRAFTGGLASELPGDFEQVMNWLRDKTQRMQALRNKTGRTQSAGLETVISPDAALAHASSLPAGTPDLAPDGR